MLINSHSGSKIKFIGLDRAPLSGSRLSLSCNQQYFLLACHYVTKEEECLGLMSTNYVGSKARIF